MNVRPDVYNCPLWLRGLAWSIDKLKSLYLHYHSVYDHQTCKDGDISWRAPNHKVIQSIDHVALQGHVTKQKPLYIYYKSASGNQTWQNDDSPWWALTYNVAWPFDHAALWDKKFAYRRRLSSQTLKLSPRVNMLNPLSASVALI